MSFSWYVDVQQMEDKARALEIYADECNDSHDHDEGHAAAAVLRTFAHRGIIPGDYIIRWIEGLI